MALNNKSMEEQGASEEAPSVSPDAYLQALNQGVASIYWPGLKPEEIESINVDELFLDPIRGFIKGIENGDHYLDDDLDLLRSQIETIVELDRQAGFLGPSHIAFLANADSYVRIVRARESVREDLAN